MAMPTVGRVVYVHYDDGKAKGEQPMAAIVAYVNTNKTVNLNLISPTGSSSSEMGVPFIDEGMVPPEFGYYAEWMPYQLQAAKKELLGSEYLDNACRQQNSKQLGEIK